VLIHVAVLGPLWSAFIIFDYTSHSTHRSFPSEIHKRFEVFAVLPLSAVLVGPKKFPSCGNSERLPLTWSVNLNKQYAVRITVGDCCANGLDAFHDPVPPSPLDQTGNPHHGLIFGLVPMRESNSNAYEAAIDALAKASTIVALT
jgi:hypothetical protein